MPEKNLYNPLDLDAHAVQRLFLLAPLFDITVVPVPGGGYLVGVERDGCWQSTWMCAERVHLRVLTEVCEKLVPWVYFHEGEHCAMSLLKHTDARLSRLAQLYQRSKEAVAADAGSRLPVRASGP